jgi:dienelactone hydrolase
MRKLMPFLVLGLASAGQPLPNTKLLDAQGDLAVTMVEGIVTYLERATADSVSGRRPSRDRLARILGVMDQRVAFDAPRLLATTAVPALIAETPRYRAFAVSWPVLEGVSAEGLLYQPTGAVRARVVALPDADGHPEQLAVARMLAAAGCQVLSPVLIDRKDTWSGVARFRMTNQPHREFIYRMAFALGRHIWGYEVQKVLAAVDWFAAQPDPVPIGVWGYGEGGGVALFAAALDERIQVAGVSGYFQPREAVHAEPLYRNVFGLVKDFGDAEVASLIAPRTLIIDSSPGPLIDGPPPATAQRRGAAPGRLKPVPVDIVRAEFNRARAMFKGGRLALEANGSDAFAQALGVKLSAPAGAGIPTRDTTDRQKRQFNEIVSHVQKLIPASETVRNALWAKTERATLDVWNKEAVKLRSEFWNHVIGRLPAAAVPLNPRTRAAYSGTSWAGYDVVYDVAPDVIGYGVLLVPKGIPAGEKRPVVVVQHGLEGRPQHLFGLEEIEQKDGRATPFHYYQNIGSKLAERGYVVYMPQNPYIGDFRRINRLANPLGLSLFSFIIAQHDRLLDWLSSIAYVDPAKIGFYGLSYGGKTALRVPPLLPRYALSICSGDFNEWVYKVSSIDAPYTYPFTPEWEISEFDLASVANHAEMAKMMAPRPFMVERGHRDGVGVDEWVAYEYAKVKRFYDEMGIGDRTEIEYFNGPHKIHGVGTIQFIRKHLGR